MTFLSVLRLNISVGATVHIQGTDYDKDSLSLLSKQVGIQTQSAA